MPGTRPAHPVRLPRLILSALRAAGEAPGRLPRTFAGLARGLAARARARIEQRLTSGGDPCLVRLEGVTLRVPLPLATAFVDRRFDPLTIGRLSHVVRPGMLAVDVGAHVGFYTLLLARLVGPGGRVVAVEPAPDNAALLEQNLVFAPDGRVEIIMVAAGRDDRERALGLSDSSDTHSFYQHPLSPSVGSVVVRERRLDRLLTAPPDIVKVDVEGAELEVLEGLEGVVGGSGPLALLVEVNPACLAAAGTSGSELLSWLDAHGLRELELIDEQAGAIHRGAEARRAVSESAHPRTWFANLLARRI